MNDLDPAAVSGTSNEAVEKATGQPWGYWMALLDEAGGREMSHKQLVFRLAQDRNVSEWWQQQIAVAYEKSRGLRAEHQMADGYQISRSRTVAAPAERVYEAWTVEAERLRWLPYGDFSVRKATPNKSLRLNWHDGTRVEVRLTPKGDRTQVAVQQNKLPDAEAAERMKAYWAAALERLQEAVAQDSYLAGGAS
jgi:uncharacterized protein YndB with AHSA1/START domain